MYAILKCMPLTEEQCMAMQPKAIKWWCSRPVTEFFVWAQLVPPSPSEAYNDSVLRSLPFWNLLDRDEVNVLVNVLFLLNVEFLLCLQLLPCGFNYGEFIICNSNLLIELFICIVLIFMHC